MFYLPFYALLWSRGQEILPTEVVEDSGYETQTSLEVAPHGPRKAALIHELHNKNAPHLNSCASFSRALLVVVSCSQLQCRHAAKLQLSTRFSSGKAQRGGHGLWIMGY